MSSVNTKTAPKAKSVAKKPVTKRPAANMPVRQRPAGKAKAVPAYWRLKDSKDANNQPWHDEEEALNKPHPCFYCERIFPVRDLHGHHGDLICGRCYGAWSECDDDSSHESVSSSSPETSARKEAQQAGDVMASDIPAPRERSKSRDHEMAEDQ